MDISMLEKIVARDAAVVKQEISTLAPKKDAEVVSNENGTSSNVADLGSDTTQKVASSNETSTDVKPTSETSKDGNTSPVDKSKLSQQEKMEYAFKKEFGKEKKRHQAEIDALRSELNEIKKATAKPEPVITADNFDTVEEYNKWLIKQETAKALNEYKQNEINNKIQVEEINNKKSEVHNVISELYKTPDEIKLYNSMVQEAIDNGLDDYLNAENKERTIRSFIDNSPIGPRVLQHLIWDTKRMNEIYNIKDPIDKRVELKLLERELKQHIALQKTNVTAPIVNKPVVPIMGKIGSNVTTNGDSKLSKQETEAEAMRFLKSRRII